MRLLSILLLALLSFTCCQVITDPTPDDCREVAVLIESITEGTSADIKLHDSQSGNWYYINRGLEKDLTVKGLRAIMLDAPAKLWVVKNSRHVAQIAVRDSIVYSEFSE